MVWALDLVFFNLVWFLLGWLQHILMSGWFELLIWHFFLLGVISAGLVAVQIRTAASQGKVESWVGSTSTSRRIKSTNPFTYFYTPSYILHTVAPYPFFLQINYNPLAYFCKSEERSVQLFSLVCHRRREVWVTKVKMAKVLRGSVCCGRLLCFLSQQLSQTVGLISTLPAKNCQRIVNKIYKTFSQQLPQKVFPAH